MSPEIVWFKKDLRISDHRPLREARQRGTVMGLYVLEPQWLASDEYSHIHHQFLEEALADLEVKLAELRIPLLILKGEAVQVFEVLHRRLNFARIYSHEETGVHWTYQRDLAVAKWCRAQGVQWREFRQFAVLRGLRDRDRWQSQRNLLVERPTLNPPRPQEPIKMDLSWLSMADISSPAPRLVHLQTASRVQALETLESFLSSRGRDYRTEMSSPVTAFSSCSRISPYLSWGLISLSEVIFRLRGAQRELLMNGSTEAKKWSASLRSFESRLWWHCHFIQKLESEPEIEFHNMNRGFDGMRENDFCTEKFEAWQQGQTGYPLIDACMRALHQEGWINFRMRAMLISFASYQLWLHWRKPAQHLARLFVDFEPGIHFSQIQMQSGVTGINTIRIYSPIKQAQDNDPDGVFIKKYCPELRGIDNEYIHQPHLMPPMLQTLCGVKIGKDYPWPIVDHPQAYKYAREKIFTWKNKPMVRELAKDVYRRHGSRKSSNFKGPIRLRRI